MPMPRVATQLGRQWKGLLFKTRSEVELEWLQRGFDGFGTRGPIADPRLEVLLSSNPMGARIAVVTMASKRG